MALSDVAKKIGVKFDDGADDGTIEKALVSFVAGLKKSAKDAKKTSKPIAAAIMDVVRENRENKVKGLVDSGKITPAVAKDLTEQFCGDTSLSLSLQDEPVDDGFKGIVAALTKNGEVTSFKEKSGPQATLDKDGNPKKSGLVLSAEKIAKSVK